MIRATTTPATTCAATSVRNCHIGATSFRGLAHSPNLPKSRRRRNAERPGSLPAFVVCCELYRPDYFAMQVAQKLLNSAISASLSWPCISVSRSLSAMSAWVNSCVATFP